MCVVCVFFGGGWGERGRSGVESGFYNLNLKQRLIVISKLISSKKNHTCKFPITFIPGCVLDVPEYPYDQNYDQFAFHSLLTRKESIEATGKVRTECNKVCGMSLFHIPTTKPMRLEEFEQTQSQATSQVRILYFITPLFIMQES